jgi:hypothetical protein
MSFSKVIKSNYYPMQQKSLLSVLKTRSLYDKLKQLTDSYYISGQQGDNGNRLMHFRNMVSEIMALTLGWYRNEPDCEAKKKDADCIMHLVYTLIKQAIHCGGKEQAKYFSVVQHMVESEQQNIAWKKFLLHFFAADIRISLNRMPQKNGKKNNKRSANPFLYFKWSIWPGDKDSKISPDAFLNDLMTALPGLKTIKTLALLFRPCCMNYRIELPSEHLDAFLTIFRELHQSKRLHCNINRGLYRHLKAHLAAPESDHLPARSDYAKLHYDMMKDTEQRSKTRQKILHLIRKYCEGMPEQQ